MSIETNEENSFDSIDSAIADIAAGKMVIVTDDESRENEGDLVMAASKVTAEAVNQMALHARGLICVPMLSDQLRRLGINSMASEIVNRNRLILQYLSMPPEGLPRGLAPTIALRRSVFSEIQILKQKCWFNQVMSFH